MSKSTNTKDEIVEVITRHPDGQVSVDGGKTWWCKSDFKQLSELLAKDRQQLIQRIKEELPEPKQIEFYRKNGLGTEENRQKHYRYGGYDFALLEVEQILETMEKNL